LLVLAALTKTRRYKMKMHVPLFDVTVKSVAGSKRDENEFEVKSTKKKPFTVICGTQKERDEWVAAIEVRANETRRNPPPNSPVAGRTTEGSDDASDGFALNKTSVSAAAAAATADDFGSFGPSKHFKPIGGVDVKSGDGARDSGSVSGLPSGASAAAAAGAGGGANPGISEAAARLGIVEAEDQDPEFKVLFTSDAYEPAICKPQSLFVVI